MEGLNDYLNDLKLSKIFAIGENVTREQLRSIISRTVRTEKLAIKDIKLRTFIAEGNRRNDLATHVYDITYDSIVPDRDNIVVIDDSIVRGTTLKMSIIKILSRLNPKKIVVVSSSPQVRYPDCYGIDMSHMEEFIAFNAAIELLRRDCREDVIDGVYEKCKEALARGGADMPNCVKEIYDSYSYDEISRQIAKMVTPEDCPCQVSVVYQTIEDLNKACPANNGDWYFSGNYPTPGGNRLVNKSFVSYYERFVEK